MGEGQREVWEEVKERYGRKSKRGVGKSQRGVGEGQREVWEKGKERYGKRSKRGMG